MLSSLSRILQQENVRCGAYCMYCTQYSAGYSRKSARNSFLAFNSVYYIRISVYGFLYFRIRYAYLLFTTTQKVHFQLLRHYRPIGNPTAISCLFPAGSTLSIGYPGIPYYSGVSYIQAFHLLDGRRTIAHFTQRRAVRK